MKKTNLLLAALATCIMFSVLTAFVFQKSENLTNSNFEALLKTFPKGQLPYAIKADNLQKAINTDLNTENKQQKVDKTKIIRGKAAEILPFAKEAMFSRVPTTTEAVMAFETPTYHALVYKQSRGFSALYNTYYVSIFNKKGKHIRSELFSTSNNVKIIEGALDDRLNLTLKTYEIKWDEEDADNRKIQSLTFENQSTVNLTKPKSDSDIIPVKEAKKEMIAPIQTKAR